MLRRWSTLLVIVFGLLVGMVSPAIACAAAAKQGDAFSLPAFHDRLLELGSLPLPALQAEMA